MGEVESGVYSLEVCINLPKTRLHPIEPHFNARSNFPDVYLDIVESSIDLFEHIPRSEFICH